MVNGNEPTQPQSYHVHPKTHVILEACSGGRSEMMSKKLSMLMRWSISNRQCLPFPLILFRFDAMPVNLKVRGEEGASLENVRVSLICPVSPCHTNSTPHSYAKKTEVRGNSIVIFMLLLQPQPPPTTTTTTTTTTHCWQASCDGVEESSSGLVVELQESVDAKHQDHQHYYRPPRRHITNDSTSHLIARASSFPIMR